MWFPLQLFSVTLWAAVNVLDSILVHRFEKNPVTLLWYQSLFSIPLLGAIAFTQDLGTPWMPALLLSGVIAYLGDRVFFRALEVIDVSVANIAWVILSVFLSLSGFLFLGEAWTAAQSIGVLCIFAGILLLSLWHRKVSDMRSLLWLPLLALLYTPFYLLQKHVLLQGEEVLRVFFWAILGRELCGFVIPLILPSYRRRIQEITVKNQVSFHLLNGVVIAFFFSGTFFTTWAFETGPLSLVSIVGNVQPFIVLLLAWLLCRVAPSCPPRELLTQQSVGVKLISFF